MNAIQLLAIISLLLLAASCVPTAEELAGINDTESKTVIKEPEIEVKQEITVMPPKILGNKTENLTIQSSERKENITTATQKAGNATAAPITGVPTIIYTGGAIEMGEGERVNIIIK